MLCTNLPTVTPLVLFETLKTLQATFRRVGFISIDNDNTRRVANEILNETSASTQPFIHATKNDGTITYSAQLTSPGPTALAFLNSEQLSDTFRTLTGCRHSLTEKMSCITVYESGDQLSPHIDQPAKDCGLTCILYLSCKSPEPLSPDTGLRLQVYGQEQQSTLETPVVEIASVSGHMVIGKGTLVWHGRPPLKEAETVMALTSCFHCDL